MHLERRRQILAMILVPTLLSLALLVMVLRESLHGWAEQRWSNDHLAFVAALGSRIDADIGQASALLQFAARTPEFAALPDSARVERALNGLPEALEPAKRRLLESLRVQGQFSALFVLTPEGDHYMAHPFAVQRALGKYNLAERSYFQQARSSGAPVVSDSFVGADGMPAIAIDVPVPDAAGNIALHLGGVLHLSRLSGLLTASSIAPFERAVLRDRMGRRIADSAPDWATLAPGALPDGASDAVPDARLAPGTVTVRALSDRQGARWFSFHTRTKLGWDLYLYRREQLVLDEIAPQVRTVTLIAAGILLLPSLLGLLLALRFSRRWQVADRALKLSNATLESRIAQRTAELQKSETRWRTLFEATPDAVLIISAGHYVDCNPAAVRLFGARGRDAILGRAPAELSPATQFGTADSRAEAERLLARVLAGENLSFEWQHRRLDDGPDFIAKVLLNPILIEGQTLIQVTLRDVTERRQAKEALRIAATAFESQEGMFITDAARVIVRVNRSFTEITGYSAQDAVGQTPHLLSSGRHDGAFFAAMNAAIGHTGNWSGEIWNRRKNGEVYPEWLTITAVRDEAGAVSNFVATLTDITFRKAAENEINSLAFYDPLTRLPNRRLLLDRLKQALAASARHAHYGALLYIDLDNFKTLNDTLGHDVGDQLLDQVGRRLGACVRDSDTVARLGGDEFIVMLAGLDEQAQLAAGQAETVGEKILVALNQPYQLGRHVHHSTPSIGITLFGRHNEPVEDLLKRADLAMYQSKAAGRNTLRFFDPQMQAALSRRAAMEADLRAAVAGGQFVLHYQAQVVDAGRLVGAEALVRWQHPQRGLVMPGEFIALAEETGLILPLGHWVLERACAELARWADAPELAHLCVAVNVSARQFRHKDFVGDVLGVLARSGARAQRLKLELTESLLVDDVQDVIAKMDALRAHGVGFSLDDFGTGYSSLSYLKRLPLDQLKIDQGFVRNILTDPNDAAIAKMVIALADSLGLAVIAEGVETDAQRDFLARLGCHAYQGYLFSRPLALDVFELYARSHGARRAAALA